MLGQYFYHELFRKSVIAFANVFNNIIIKRQRFPGTPDQQIIESLSVPIQYGSYEKFLARIATAPTDVRQQTEWSLPRIAFNITGLTYDGSRKVVPTQFMKSLPDSEKTDEKKQYKQYMPIPYNLQMSLDIIAKTQSDGFQILEQILAFLHPTISVSIEVIEDTREERDIIIQLDNIQYVDDFEGAITERGTLIWTLNFTVKTYIFGPIDTQKDIRKITLDYRTDIVDRNAELRYTAEVVSTETPPVPRDQIDPNSDNYKIIEKYEDIYSNENSFFGIN